MDPYHQSVLLEMGGWLATNGDAVYDTVTAQHQQNMTTAEGVLVYFTSSADGRFQPGITLGFASLFPRHSSDVVVKVRI
jgi:alpha-L-fucosidase